MPKAENQLKALIIKYLKNFIILTCSLSNSLCAGADSLIILAVEKTSPLHPLSLKRGGKEQKIHSLKKGVVVDCLVILAVGKTSPLHPLSLKRGRKEQKIYSLKKWFKPITVNVPLFKERDSKKEQTLLPLIGRGVVAIV